MFFCFLFEKKNSNFANEHRLRESLEHGAESEQRSKPILR